MSVIIKAFFTVIIVGILVIVLKNSFSESGKSVQNANETVYVNENRQKSNIMPETIYEDKEIICFKSIETNRVISFPLTRNGIEVGREQLAAYDTYMSRRHFTVGVKQGKVVISNINSNNPVIMLDKDMSIVKKHYSPFALESRKSVVKLGRTCFEVMIPEHYASGCDDVMVARNKVEPGQTKLYESR